MLVAALGALALTIALVVGRPRIGRFGRLDPALGALPGVLVMLSVGVLSFRDVGRAGLLLWRPLLTVAAVMAMTSVAHKLGILARVARIIEIRTRGPVPRGFTTVYVIGASCAAIFNNDAAILLLTPIIVPLVQRMYPRRPYLVVPFAFAVFVSAGVAPLCTSNPMNLVVAERVGIGFNAYALRMIPVAIVGSIGSYLMLRVIFRSQLEDDIPATGVEQGSLAPMEDSASAVLVVVGAMLLAYPILSYFEGPVWIAASCGAFIVCAIGMRDGRLSVKEAVAAVAWDVLAFLFIIFLTALGLENVGLTKALAQVYDLAGEHTGAQIALTGSVSAVGSALLNNHPVAALNSLAIASLPGDGKWHTLAALVGGDLGPRFLPMGSLAGLLWIEMLRRLGVEIRTSDFVRVGFVVTVPALVASLGVLWLESAIGGTDARPHTVIVDGEPELAFPGVVTTEHSEVKLTFSPDGRRILWGSTDRTGGAGAWDIWEVVRQGDGWSEPHAVSFNSPANDFDPSFASDGVYFFSNRPGGIGGDDVYFAPFADDRYGAAQNLGPGINSQGDEWGPVVSPDGQRLLFATDGRGGKGKHDLFVAKRDGATWGAPENLGPDINSELDDFDAAFLHDGRTLVFASERRGADQVDLHVSSPTGGRYPVPTWLGSKLNAPDAWDFGVAIDRREPGVLYYNSRRPPNVMARSDIYRVRYHFGE